MKMPQIARIAPAALMTLALAMPAAAAPALREDNLANPRGWSAMTGMTSGAVVERAGAHPAPVRRRRPRATCSWCDHNAGRRARSAMISARKDCRRQRRSGAVGVRADGHMDMVLERADATSCVIASGIGFSDRTSPQEFFVKAGLDS